MECVWGELNENLNLSVDEESFVGGRNVPLIFQIALHWEKLADTKHIFQKNISMNLKEPVVAVKSLSVSWECLATRDLQKENT